MQRILETKRIILREFIISDAPFVLELLNSPGWLDFIGDRNVKDLESANTYILDKLRKPYTAFGYGFYAMQLHNGDPIGMCGLIKRDYLEHPDIGFALLPDFEGQGFAFEASKATLDYAKNKLKIPTITAITVPENMRSINLLTRLGLKEAGNLIHPGTEELLLVFSIDLLG